MIQWVYERARAARGIDRVIVATDDERIARAVRGFGGEAEMTSASLASGTDRVAAVADRWPSPIYVNVQGDEPMIQPAVIERALGLVSSGRFGLGTARTKLRDARELEDPAVVKVLTDREDRAIYFSRFPIPYSRGPRPASPAEWVPMRHVGLYVYDHATLMRFRALPPAALEQAEMLEQLRALHAGIPIGVAEVDFASIGVDTPDDLEKVRKLLVKQ